MEPPVAGEIEEATIIEDRIDSFIFEEYNEFLYSDKKQAVRRGRNRGGASVQSCDEMSAT